MNTILRSAVAIAALLVAAPSMAADLLYAPAAPVASAPVEVAPEPVYEAAGYDWTGGYAGVVIGHGWGSAEQNGTGAFDAAGWLVGGTLGFNVETNDIVYGVEGDLSWTDFGGASGTRSSDLDWVGTLRGRVGFDIDGVMPYVTGGFALADINASDSAVPYAVSEYQAGLTAGAGIEIGLVENLSVKAEYSYTHFNGDWDFNAGNGVDSDATKHAVKTGLNFRF